MLDTQTRKRSETRDRLLEAAESAVLAKGFTATSIEELIAEVGITKSGFFYHFKDKNELARAMMLRYLERDAALLDGIFARGDDLHDDPLHGFLVGLKLFAELLADLPENHPGCLAASFCYQDQLFDQGIRDMTAGSFLIWRRRFRARFDEIVKTHPANEDMDLDALADMAATLVEGALILGRALKDASILPRQILLYRDYVKMIFRN
jgi:AcrR family transcriptional regulator